MLSPLLRLHLTLYWGFGFFPCFRGSGLGICRGVFLCSEGLDHRWLVRQVRKLSESQRFSHLKPAQTNLPKNLASQALLGLPLPAVLGRFQDFANHIKPYSSDNFLFYFIEMIKLCSSNTCSLVLLVCTRRERERERVNNIEKFFVYQIESCITIDNRIVLIFSTASI